MAGNPWLILSTKSDSSHGGCANIIVWMSRQTVAVRCVTGPEEEGVTKSRDVAVYLSVQFRPRAFNLLSIRVLLATRIVPVEAYFFPS